MIHKNIIGIEHIYIVSVLVMAAIWCLVFLSSKQVRKEMFWVSLFFGLSAWFQEAFYIADWWHPITVTHTRLGIEDFLFTFSMGAMAVLYQLLSNKKFIEKGSSRESKRIAFISVLIFVITLLLTFILFKWHSFSASASAFTLAILYLWFYRKDLIQTSLMSGVIAVLIGILWFQFFEWLTPGWVASTWYLDKLSGIMIVKAPIEDLIWGVVGSAYIAIVYKVWKNSRYEYSLAQKS